MNIINLLFQKKNLINVIKIKYFQIHIPFILFNAKIIYVINIIQYI